MNETPTPAPLVSDPAREAVDVLRGYSYQMLRSVETWLDLGPCEILVLEGAEDLDRIGLLGATVEQVKDTVGSGNLTLRNPNALAAIRNFWQHRQRNPLAAIEFRYLTTSAIGRERGDDLDLAGPALEIWRDIRRSPTSTISAANAKVIQAYLATREEYPQSFREFLANAPVDEFILHIVQPFEWVTREPGADALSRRIETRLIERGEARNIGAADAAGALEKLHFEVLKNATSHDREPLRRGDLLRILDAAGTSAVPNDLMMSLIRQAIGQAAAQAGIPHADIGIGKAILHDLITANQDVARLLGIKEGMLIALARRYAEGDPKDFDAALAGLERALRVAHQQIEQERLSRLSHETLDLVFTKMNTLNDGGGLDAAQAVLEAQLAILDAEERERREFKVKLFERGIAQAILTRDVSNACRFVFELVNASTPPSTEHRDEAIQIAIFEWYRRGATLGLSFDLEVAIAIGQSLERRTGSSGVRAAVQTSVGAALFALGQREVDKVRLQQSAAAFRRALELLPRVTHPVQWAMTLTGLGVTLRALGLRDTKTDLVNEAIACHRMALEELPKHRFPIEWSSVQSNLGNARMTLWERDPVPLYLVEAAGAFRNALKIRKEQPDSVDWSQILGNYGNAVKALAHRAGSSALFRHAIRIYEFALRYRTRDRFPLEWATIQNNIATALLVLGQRETEIDPLNKAVAIFALVLEERGRERVPLDWAVTQTNLGTALQIIGERMNNPDLLARALEAFRLALEETTRDRQALGWAMVQNNLGNALLAIGEREEEPNRIVEAIKVYRLSLEERTREAVPLEWALTQNNLGNALQALSRRTGELAMLDDAISAFENAAQERRIERGPFDWAETQGNLANALVELGAQARRASLVERAVVISESLLSVFTRERSPLRWAHIQNNLGLAYKSLSEEGGVRLLEDALVCYDLALSELLRERNPLDWAMVQYNRAGALRALGIETQKREVLEEAVATFQQSLLERTKESVPLDWAMTCTEAGITCAILGQWLKSRFHLTTALKYLEGALTIFQQAGAPPLIDYCDESLMKARKMLAAL